MPGSRLWPRNPPIERPSSIGAASIPADGFYEWKVANGRKVPYNIRMRDGGVFALAGLWEHWEGEGECLESCFIIVMPDNDIMKSFLIIFIQPQFTAMGFDNRSTER